MTKSEIQVFINLLPFKDKVNAGEMHELELNTRFINVKENDNIHGGRNDCAGVIIVKTGLLRIYMISEQGKEITLNRIKDGDICLLSASCILKNISFSIFVDAEKDSEIFIINPNTYEIIKSNNIYVSNFTNEKINESFSDVMWIMEQILFMSFDKRLAIFLLDQSTLDGTDTINNTHEVIAKHLGTAREVVSRMLKYFENEGYVSQFRGGIKLIDKKALRDLI